MMGLSQRNVLKTIYEHTLHHFVSDKFDFTSLLTMQCVVLCAFATQYNSYLNPRKDNTTTELQNNVEINTERQTDRHVYLESFTMNSTSTTTDIQITKNYKQQVTN